MNDERTGISRLPRYATTLVNVSESVYKQHKEAQPLDLGEVIAPLDAEDDLLGEMLDT